MGTCVNLTNFEMRKILQRIKINRKYNAII